MIKILFSLIIAVLPLFQVVGQIAVHAGATFTKWNCEQTDFRSGFVAGVAWHLQNESSPLFGQVNLDFTQKGANLNTHDEHGDIIKMGVNTYLVHVPVFVGYKIPIFNHMQINPKVGLYADYGLWGKISDKGYSLRSDILIEKDGKNPYSDLSQYGYSDFSRFDAGYNVGANFMFPNWLPAGDMYIELNGFFGFMDMYDGDSWKLEGAKNRSFQVSFGFVFNK